MIIDHHIPDLYLEVISWEEETWFVALLCEFCTALYHLNCILNTFSGLLDAPKMTIINHHIGTSLSVWLSSKWAKFWMQNTYFWKSNYTTLTWFYIKCLVPVDIRLFCHTFSPLQYVINVWNTCVVPKTFIKCAVGGWVMLCMKLILVSWSYILVSFCSVAFSFSRVCHVFFHEGGMGIGGYNWRKPTFTKSDHVNM